MVPNKGLYLDSNPIDQPQGTWRDARNVLINEKRGAYSPEQGSDLTATDFPFATAKPIGTTQFPDGSYVVYADGINGGEDRIGVVNTSGVYTDLIIDDILNFSSDYPILASEFEYNYLGQRVISFTDNNNPPRLLNIDFLPFNLNINKSLVNDADIQDILAFPVFKTPNISYTLLNGSGAVKAGGYTFCVYYENNDGTKTSNTIPIGSVYVTEDVNPTFATYDGVEPGSLTSKAIRLSLTNVDTTYDKIGLIAIQSIKGIVTALEISRKTNIVSSSMTIDYIGTETTTELDLEQVITPKPLYKKSKAMTQQKGVLYHGNLEAEQDIDYQSYANNIRIFYTSRLVSVNNLDTSHKTSKLPSGFAHGEVYAFYIHFILKNGSLSKGFHIPGRSIFGGESPSPTATSAYGGGTTGTNSLAGAKRYQIEGSTDKGGHTYVTDSDGTRRVTSMASNTNMGYWENQNENYPSGFPNLAGQKVRHHVFPTFEACKSKFYSAESEYLKSKLDLLGIEVTNVTIPVEIQDKVEGWVISYAKKTYESSTIYGMDLLCQTARRSGGDQQLRYDNFTNGSIDWDDGGNGNLIMVNDYARGHIVDLLIDKPQLSTDKLYVNALIAYDGFPNTTLIQSDAGISRFVGRVGDDRNGLIVLYDYINATQGTTSNSVRIQNTGFITGVTEFKYIPNGVIDGKLINSKSGESIWMKAFPTFGFIPSPIYTHVPDWDFNGGTPHIDNDFERTFLYNLRQVKDNVHSLYSEQELILTNKINTNLNNNFLQYIYGGDRFITNRTVMQMGANAYNLTDEQRRAMSIRHHISESRYNFGLRYEIPSQDTTKYYPKTSPHKFINQITSTDEDLIFAYGANTSDVTGYSKDYNLINIFNSPLIYEPSQITTNKFPNRVIRSGVTGANQNSLNSWKTYLSNDIYEGNRNRGEIINLTTLDDVLIIHHKYGLFRTVGKDKLTFDTTEVYLGTGDIFNQEPKEPIPSKLGYLGTQNVFSCFNFKGGYAWWDQSQGRAFMLTPNGVTEISNLGLYNYFRDNSLINSSLPDNPIAGEGLMGTYDPKFNRLIFSKKSNENPFTLSYSLDDNCWVSWLDYTPDYMFSNNKTFFAFKDNKIHKFNSDTRRAKYFEGDVNPTSITLVYNQAPEINKIFFNTNWISEFYDNNNQLDLSKTLTSIRFKTNYQDTGEIDLIPFSTYGANHNIRAERSTWNFNKLRDQNADVYKKKFLVGNYALGTYVFDNAPNLDSSQNLLYLYNFNVKVRKSEL